ncbi:hypothetical protein B0H63DRAFT_185191 [Podospora didyma]|uniref:Uncharacterized protein n=1 Tax=Podospora didyma TaxID=330526 RepID=A0AAE0NQG6_9PEZI|nr:hypothetical protein B0H63DRAFT_185191 [Podospora didyma]
MSPLPNSKQRILLAEAATILEALGQHNLAENISDLALSPTPLPGSAKMQLPSYEDGISVDTSWILETEVGGDSQAADSIGGGVTNVNTLSSWELIHAPPARAPENQLLQSTNYVATPVPTYIPQQQHSFSDISNAPSSNQTIYTADTPWRDSDRSSKAASKTHTERSESRGRSCYPKAPDSWTSSPGSNQSDSQSQGMHALPSASHKMLS